MAWPVELCPETTLEGALLGRRLLEAALSAGNRDELLRLEVEVELFEELIVEPLELCVDVVADVDVWELLVE